MQILVVEDEPRIANLIRRGLVEESYAVDLAGDGEQALDKFTVNSYDLIILDVMLPKKDGVSVCREIRQKDTSIPILLLTARGSLDDRVTGLNSGADDYMVKPFSFEELIARVKALLRRSPHGLPTILSLDDLTMNTATREVLRSSKRIDLTAREYSLLDYLLRNQTIALSKSQIIDHVWDYNYDGVSNVVETYIRYLRKKLRVLPKSRELVHTVRGYGYVMKVNDHV
jgi:DNA-binding response OmpR family regulator